MQTSEIVPLERFHERRFGQILCYPKWEQEELEERLIELENLKVRAVEFTGKKRVFDLLVLGKGCVGIVVLVHTSLGKAALKIRRVDADRNGMFHEGDMLRIANTLKIGPKLLDISENFILMEFIEGIHFPTWIELLGGIDLQLRLQRVLHDVLEQCYRLDEANLDHGELSNAAKHIIVDEIGFPHLVDFETASIKRKVSNVTSICRFFFFRSQISDQVLKKLKEIEEKHLLIAVGSYKRKRTRKNFEKILEKARLIV